jgi:hypothetical protein
VHEERGKGEANRCHSSRRGVGVGRFEVASTFADRLESLEATPWLTDHEIDVQRECNSNSRTLNKSSCNLQSNHKNLAHDSPS